MSIGYAPITSARSVAGSAIRVNRRGPPAALSLRYSAAGVLPAGEVEVRSAVGRAVEDRHAAADREWDVPPVRVVDPGPGCLVDEVGRPER